MHHLLESKAACLRISITRAHFVAQEHTWHIVTAAGCMDEGVVGCCMAKGGVAPLTLAPCTDPVVIKSGGVKGLDWGVGGLLGVDEGVGRRASGEGAMSLGSRPLDQRRSWEVTNVPCEALVVCVCVYCVCVFVVRCVSHRGVWTAVLENKVSLYHAKRQFNTNTLQLTMSASSFLYWLGKASRNSLTAAAATTSYAQQKCSNCDVV